MNCDRKLTFLLTFTNQLHPYQCLYLTYQSLEDWTELQDILRCNPDFQGEPRYDCIIINMDLPSGQLSIARLRGLFNCRLSSGETCDVALVCMLPLSKWKPKTKWEGCRIDDELKEPRFIMAKYLLHGAHMISAFGASESPLKFYLNDTIDSDMFLRAGN